MHCPQAEDGPDPACLQPTLNTSSLQGAALEESGETHETATHQKNWNTIHTINVQYQNTQKKPCHLTWI